MSRTRCWLVGHPPPNDIFGQRVSFVRCSLGRSLGRCHARQYSKPGDALASARIGREAGNQKTMILHLTTLLNGFMLQRTNAAMHNFYKFR